MSLKFTPFEAARRGIAIGFATSRAQSMKSCATAVRVRFFNVTIPTGMCALANSMGRALIVVRKLLNPYLPVMVRNLPLATSAKRAISV